MDFKRSIVTDGNVTAGGNILCGGVVSGTNLTMTGYSTSIGACRVKKTTTQTISSTTNTKIIFNSVDYDLLSDWDSVNNGYIASTAGIYNIIGTARCTGTLRSSKLMVYKNGVFYCSLMDRNTTASSSPFYTGTTDIQLAVNDYIEIWIYTSGTTTLAATDTYACFKRVA